MEYKERKNVGERQAEWTENMDGIRKSKWKRTVAFGILAGMFLLAGCKKKEEVPILDYVRTNQAPGVMKTDKGFYYNNDGGAELSLHYYDEASGQNIYLCSRPECRHDGDQFCTATNSRYHVYSTCLYGDKLYINVLEETDNEYLGKLLCASTDGTKLSEVVTYLTVNKTSVYLALSGTVENMIIHRGKVVLPYSMRGQTNWEEGAAGAKIYDLVTGELTELEEKDIKECKGYEYFSAIGDYIYFNTAYTRKNRLSRYSIVDGTVEELELLRNFSGIYTLFDEDRIFYKRSSSDHSLYEYHVSTKENIEHQKTLVREKESTITVEGQEFPFTYEMTVTASDFMSDGTYLYVGERVSFDTSSIAKIILDGEETHLDLSVLVYDKELKLVADVSLDNLSIMREINFFTLRIFENNVYIITPVDVYSCALEEFMTGEPTFTHVFEMVDIYNDELGYYQDWIESNQ